MRLGGCRTCVQRGPTRDAASDAVACPSVPRLSFFFFFFFLRFAPTRLDSRCSGSIHAKSASICTEPARIGLYQPNRIVSTGGRKRPKSALNHAGTAEIGFEWDPNILNLSFLNFILNICCFFCVFFFVLCFVLFCVSCLLLSLFCEPRP